MICFLQNRIKLLSMKKPTSPLIASHNWSDFRYALSSLSSKEKGDRFEQLVRYYLLLHPTYQTILTDVWLLASVPAEVKDHLRLPHTDEGIDLIARTKECKYWAIQCKYVDDESSSIGRRKLSTFTDLLNLCPNIELGLVCSTTERFSHKMKMYGDRISFLAADIWRSLDADFFSTLHKHLSNRRATIRPASPRPHQQEALKEAVHHFVADNNSRGKLIMPCGSGKSLTGWWLAEKLGAKLVLVAVPSLSLIRQTLQVWAHESVANNKEISWIAVCSDESVASNKSDDAVVLTQDLGVKIHTNSDEISDWLSQEHDGMTVVFSTYQSGEALAAASRKAGVIYDLGILDEAHKTVGQRDKLYSHLLHNENIPISRRIFMTATERRYRGDSDDIASMDIPDLYGDTFYLLSFKSALECDPPILSDYRIVTVNVTRKEIEELISANVLVKPDRGVWNNEVEAEMLASLVALRKAMQKYPIKHAVSFHSSISRASAFRESHDQFTQCFAEYGPLDTYHVTGATPTAERQRLIERFAASSRSLITNARCLTEGVDVPGIDCVLFADPKKSTIDIVQAVGRALRPSPDKQYGYVVIPVLIDENTPTETSYDSILMTLRALASNDERIVEEFRSISQGTKQSSTNIVSIDTSSGVGIDAGSFIEAIELQIWSRLAKLSWRPFEEAREFVHSLGLSGDAEWRLFCKGLLTKQGSKPPDIPAVPWKIYNGCGWLNLGDWLGTGTISAQLKVFRSFSLAREFVHKLNIKSTNEWIKYCAGELSDFDAKPSDIPSSPQLVYKDKGWIGIADWLGTKNVATSKRVYIAFEDALSFVRSLKLKNQSEWGAYWRIHSNDLTKDIPSHPDRAYKNNGWKNWGHWLGTWKSKGDWLPFKDAKAKVHALNLKSSTEWQAYTKEHPIEGVPSNPNNVYKNDGWCGIGDWLGTGNVHGKNKTYLSYNEAIKFTHSLSLKSETEWREYTKGKFVALPPLPPEIPVGPANYYKDKGWISWGEWLGTNNVAWKNKGFISFEQAKKVVHSFGIDSQTEWFRFVRGELTEKGVCPPNIPKNPASAYKKSGWKGFGDWLGTNRRPNIGREYLSYDEAKVFVKRLGLSSSTEWQKYCRGEFFRSPTLSDGIPRKPERVYKNKGWISWPDWLGIDEL